MKPNKAGGSEPSSYIPVRMYVSSVNSFRVLKSFSWGNTKPITLPLKGREVLPLVSGDNVTTQGTIIKCNDGNNAHFTGKILVPLKSKTAHSFQQWNDFILRTKPKNIKKNSLPTQPQAVAVRGCTGWVSAAVPAAAGAEHRGGHCSQGCTAAAGNQTHQQLWPARVSVRKAAQLKSL